LKIELNVGTLMYEHPTTVNKERKRERYNIRLLINSSLPSFCDAKKTYAW